MTMNLLEKGSQKRNELLGEGFQNKWTTFPNQNFTKTELFGKVSKTYKLK